MRSPRPVDAVRFGLGIAAVIRPSDFVRLSEHTEHASAMPVVRILGGRYLVQSAGGYLLNQRWVPALDATVDLIHAVSMLGLAARMPAHRKLALLSAAAATAFAVADLDEHRR